MCVDAQSPRFDRRATVHDHVEPRGGGTICRVLIDHSELHPYGVDAKPFALGDGVVDNRADAHRVDEAVDDVDVRAVRNLRERPETGFAVDLGAAWMDRNDSHSD